MSTLDVVPLRSPMFFCLMICFCAAFSGLLCPPRLAPHLFGILGSEGLCHVPTCADDTEAGGVGP